MRTALATAATSGSTSAQQPWDEMANGRGGLRPGWSGLLASVFGLGADVLARRADLLDRMFIEDGVTGLLPGVAPVAWRCDPLPMLLRASEFEQLEAGLTQRATLIDAVLRDVYGPQTLLAEGRIPPALVYANPAFLRPCRDIDAEPGQRLHAYAVEIMRGPDGLWRVVADRTADAAGIAYVLENRRSLGRAIPELFRTLPPRSLGPFFDAWQDTLQRLAPEGVDRPGLALLTPGVDDKLWYEHVVLARKLSCMLVESSDLTVRDGGLFLKTMRGLQPIHVLLRRQDGRTLDPLELEPTHHRGVTGLLDAARSGSVRIINDPGTGCIEAPMWSAVLPHLAQRVLGQDLMLPSVETGWLGDPDTYARVMAGLSDWRIRPALDGTVGAIPPPETDAEWAELVARIEAAPQDFVASAPLRPSLAPCVAADGLQPRPVLLRMFLLFDGERWRVLPGGLGRTLTQRDFDASRLPLHALCKDVWVASEDQENIVGPQATQSTGLPLRRAATDLPSRIADNFFWLGRSLERMEGSARLLRAALDRVERPGPSPRESAELRSVAACLAISGMIGLEEVGGLGAEGLGQRLMSVGKPPAQLPALLAEVSHLTEMLRDRLTREVQTTLTHGLRAVGQALAGLRAPEPGGAQPSLRHLEHVSTVVLGFSATVTGLAAENMVRSGGRLLLDLGRRIERAWSTARLLATVLDQPGSAVHAAPLEPGLRLALELCDSVITYRSRYLTILQPGPVLDLVLAEEGNPRALAFQLAQIRDILAELAHAPGTAQAMTAPNALLPTAASALLREVREIARLASVEPERQAASAWSARLRAVEKGISALSDQIVRQYFSVLPAAHRVGVTEDAPPLRGMA